MENLHYELFHYFLQEHNIQLFDCEMNEVLDIVRKHKAYFEAYCNNFPDDDELPAPEPDQVYKVILRDSEGTFMAGIPKPTNYVYRWPRLDIFQ